MVNKHKIEIPIFLAAFASSLYLGRILPSVLEGISLGSMVRALIPVVLLLGAGYLTTLFTRGYIGLSNLNKKTEKLSPALLFSIMLLSGIIGFILSKGAADLGFTYIGVGLLVLGGVFYSVWCYLTGDYNLGLIFFFLTLPFISFLEWDFRNTWFAGGPLGPIMVSPSLIFIWLCFLAMAASMVSKQFKVIFPYKGPAVLFLGWMFLSAIFSRHPVFSLREWWMHVVSFPLVIALVINSVNKLEESSRAIVAFAGYVLLRIAIVYYFYGQTVGYNFNMLIDMYSNFIGGKVVLHIGILAITGVAVFPIIISWLFREKNTTLRTVWFISILFVLWIIFVLQLRSSMLALLMTLPFLLFYIKVSIPRLAAVAFLLITITAIIVYMIPQALLRFAPWYSIAGVLKDQAMRLDAWQAAIRMVFDHPVLGIGPAMWSEYFPMYSKNLNFMYRINSAHNPFFTYLSNSGIVMLAGISWFYCRLINDSIVSIKNRSSEQEKSMDIGLLWSITAVTLLGLLGAVSSLTFIGWEPDTYGVTTVVDVVIAFGFIVGAISSRRRLTEHAT